MEKNSLAQRALRDSLPIPAGISLKVKNEIQCLPVFKLHLTYISFYRSLCTCRLECECECVCVAISSRKEKKSTNNYRTITITYSRPPAGWLAIQIELVKLVFSEPSTKTVETISTPKHSTSSVNSFAKLSKRKGHREFGVCYWLFLCCCCHFCYHFEFLSCERAVRGVCPHSLISLSSHSVHDAHRAGWTAVKPRQGERLWAFSAFYCHAGRWVFLLSAFAIIEAVFLFRSVRIHPQEVTVSRIVPGLLWPA